MGADRVIVVGGGIIGLATAHRLAGAGFSVQVVDPAPPPAEGAPTDGPASFGNAGHIAAEQVVPLASLETLRGAPGRLFARGGALDLPLADIATWAPFAWRLAWAARPSRLAAGTAALAALLAQAVPAWRRLADDLALGDLVSLEGHGVIWREPRAAPAGLAAWARAPVGATRWMPVSGPDLTALWPGRAPIAAGIRFTGTGRVAGPGRVLTALRRAVEAQGGAIIPGRAIGLSATPDGVTTLLEDGRDLTAPRVVLAAGVWSRPLIEGLGHRAPLIAERGYHVEGPNLGWGDRPPIAVEDLSLIATPMGDRLRVTSFVEFAGVDTAPDPRKWRRLEQHIDDLGLPMGHPRTHWMGARPTLPDYLPALGQSRSLPGLIYAFGHQHLGLTLGPVTAEIITALARGDRPPIDLAPFDLGRFER